MMKLCKIYTDDCEVCAKLGDSAKALANEYGFEYFDIELAELAANPTPITQYVVNYHIDEERMVDIPIYLLVSDQVKIQGSR